MTKTIENLFYYLHYVTDILVIVLCLLFISKIRKEPPLLLIALYSFTDLSLNALSDFFHIVINPYIWSSFTYFEYFIFTYIIWIHLKRKKVKNVIIGLSILFVLFSTIYNIITNFTSYDSMPIGVETILILVFSFYYLYEQMNDTSTLFIYNKYQFWLVIGFMIYLAGSFFINIFANHLMGDETLSKYWFLTNVSFSIMNILFAIAFLLFGRNPKKVNNPYLRPYLN